MKGSERIGIAIIALIMLAAAFAPLVAGADPNAQDVSARLQAPSERHLLGTDQLGRDLFARLVYGSRPALALVALVAVVTVPIGLCLGILAGFFGGKVDALIMRFTDIVMAFPRLVLAIAFVAAFGPGLLNAALALALTTWPAYARQARIETLVLRRSDYLVASQMAGIRGPRLLFGHVLPMCLPSAIVRLALDMARMIVAAAGLGFLGLGIRPPTAEWGSMVAEGSRVIFDQWWVAAIPGSAIFLVSMAFNLLSDGLRDLMDPRHG